MLFSERELGRIVPSQPGLFDVSDTDEQFWDKAGKPILIDALPPNNMPKRAALVTGKGDGAPPLFRGCVQARALLSSTFAGSERASCYESAKVLGEASSL